MSGVEVLCALRGACEVEVVTALEEFGTRVSVTRRCADLAELLAAAAAGLGHVALVSADLPMLDRDAVAHLHASGLRVVAVVDGRDADGWLGDRARALGADAVTGRQDVGEAVLTAAARPRRTEAPDRRDPHAPDGVPADSAASLHRDLLPGAHDDQGSDGPAPERLAPRPGVVVAVWGPTGAPGRTTLAITLAAELAALLGRPGDRGVLLVDADTYGGTVAQHLGLLDESPGLAAAARAAGQGRLDPDVLARHAPVVSGGLRVLTGLSRAVRWPELAGPSLDLVWDVARSLADVVVIDCGFCLEQDEVLTYDTRAPQRNGATLSALASADHVVVVGSAEPIGIQRLVRGLAELDEVVDATRARRSVVVNRVRASAVGARPGEAIVSALGRYANVQDVMLVPDDRAATDAALLEGRTLRESAPASPARRAVVDLGRALLAEHRPDRPVADDRGRQSRFGGGRGGKRVAARARNDH